MLKWLVFVGTGIVFVMTAPANALPGATATLPEGHVSVGSVLGGEYIIAKPLKEKYDQLRSRARLLKQQILSGEIDENEARGELSRLQEEIQAAVKQIEESKQLLMAAKVHTQKETIRFDLGSRRTLLIRAHKVRVVGWKKSHVECVLEKIVLSKEGEGVDEDFKGIRVAHRHGVASEEARRPGQPHVPKLTSDSMEPTKQQKLWMGDYDDWSVLFRATQDQEIDIVQIEGLAHWEGNRQIGINLIRKSGGGISSNVWRRHASLTVFVPKCRVIGVRGGLKGVDVESVDSSLAILGEGNIDYDVQSRIVDSKGDVTAQNIDLHVLDRIKGDVSIQHLAFSGNSSTRHECNSRTMHSGSPGSYTYKNISGDVRLWFCRADVHLENLSGAVDVRNEFGNTTLVMEKPLTKAAHRLVTESGSIEVQLPKKNAADLPTIAMTECGGVKCVNVSRDILDEMTIGGTTAPDGVKRSWGGFVSRHLRPHRIFALIERINGAVSGKKREVGLDIISRAGSIRLQFTE